GEGMPVAVVRRWSAQAFARWMGQPVHGSLETLPCEPLRLPGLWAGAGPPKEPFRLLRPEAAAVDRRPWAAHVLSPAQVTAVMTALRRLGGVSEPCRQGSSLAQTGVVARSRPPSACLSTDVREPLRV